MIVIAPFHLVALGADSARCFPAKPFHDFPPGFTLRTLLNDVSNLLKSFLDSYRGVAHRDVGNIMR